MRTASVTFRVAGTIGLLSLPGMYLLPGPPLYYAALAGLAAWQPVFFVIARDPARFRALMLPAVLEKAIWVATLALLYARGTATAFEVAVCSSWRPVRKRPSNRGVGAA